MPIRPFLPLVPTFARPLFSALADWIDNTDRRLAALEALAKPKA